MNGAVQLPCAQLMERIEPGKQPPAIEHLAGAHAPRAVRDRQRERFRPSAISGPSRSLDERLLISDGPPFGEGMSKDDPRAKSVQFLRHQIMIGSSSRDIHLSGSVVIYGNATRTLERYWRMLCEVSVYDVLGRCV